MTTRGKLIAIEGIDGSGKSTQAAILMSRIVKETGQACVLTAQPSDGPVGRLIRQVLDGEARL